MKIFHILFTLILVVCVPWAILQEHRSSFVSASSEHYEDDFAVAEAKGFKKIIRWGLAKVEKVFDRQMVTEMITSFLQKCEGIIEMMMTNLKEVLTMSYKELRDKEKQRITDFDVEFSELVQLRNKIERRCLYPSNKDDRSLCVENEMEIQEKIQDLRKRREKAGKALESYEAWIEWCASYNNWFC